MPAARLVIVQYSRNYTFAFNLNPTPSVVERTADGTVITNSVLLGRLTRTVTDRPDQNRHKNRGNVTSFHR
jgi:hypothetical protein